MRSVCFAASEAEGARRGRVTRSLERGPEGNYYEIRCDH